MRVTRTFLTLAIAATALAMTSAAGQACESGVHLAYGQPVEIEGQLKSKTGQHEAQGPFKALYLQLDEAVCVDPSEGDAGTETPISRIQIAGDALTANLPTGSRVKATGTLFPAHTMWHVEPVLLDASRIAPAK